MNLSAIISQNGLIALTGWNRDRVQLRIGRSSTWNTTN